MPSPLPTPAARGGADFDFSVDPDVRAASMLDKSFYLDPAVFAASRERIFARTWQWLGGLADVAERQSLSPRVLLPGLLDEPLLLARDAAGDLRCLSNVCTHRGNLLVTAACRAGQIRCGYHSRRFDLDGRMRFMPGFDGALNFPSANDDLPAAPFGAFAGQGFASLAPAAPFDAFIGPLRERLGRLPIDGFTPAPGRDRDYEFPAHWALYVENYLEDLHIPFVHPALNQTLDPDDYRHELHPHGTLQLAAARPGEPAFEPPAGTPEHGQRIAAYYGWVFPNLMFNVYPWGLSLNVVLPLAPDRTRVLFRSFVADASRLGEGAGGALEQVEMEDEAVVCGVQRGIRARLYRGGRYAPAREAGVHHFHRLIAAFMAGATG